MHFNHGLLFDIDSKERERKLPGHLGPEELEMMKSNSFLNPRFESAANM